MIRGVNHITLAVRDVVKSSNFYVHVLGCQQVARWPQGAYLLAGDVWLALVQDDHVRPGPLPEYSHIAFSVALDDFSILSARICASGAIIWQENWSEGESLYFLDPDGHKLEIHASNLAARLRAARANPWPDLKLF